MSKSSKQWKELHTMIVVRKDTRDCLKKYGCIGESYDDAITKLINFWEKKHDSKQ